MLKILQPKRLAKAEREEFENQAKRVAEAIRRRFAEVEQEAEARGLRLEPTTMYQTAPFQFGTLSIEVFVTPSPREVYFRLRENGLTEVLAVDTP